MKNIDIRQLENRLIHSSQLARKTKDREDLNFKKLLEEAKIKEKDIKFSKHAKARMDMRNIILNSDEISRLKAGFNKAEEKGVRDALILMGDKAFIASIKNKTVITTVSKEQVKNNVFTNIDGAVIV